MLRRQQFLAGFVLCAFAGIAQVRAQKTILVPSPGITTIQEGVDAANTGDTVAIAPGTYSEDIVIDGKEITLTSQSGASQTVLNGTQNSSATLTVINTPSLATTITELTIEAPYFPAGSKCESAGVGIALSDAGATIVQNTFSHVFDAVAGVKSAVTFQQNTVDLTVEPDCAAGFAGVFLAQTGSVVSNGAPAVSTVSGNTIEGNNTGSAGVVAEYSGALTIDHNQLLNHALGIILQSVDALVVIENNLIAGGGDGAIEVDHTKDDPPADPANTFIINNTMVNNLNGSTIPEPQSQNEGFAEVIVSGTSSKVALIGNIISDTSTTYSLLDCIPLSTTGYDPATPIILDHNLFWGPRGEISAGAPCPVPIGSFGNLNADPQFVSATDFQLSASSPAIDAGTTGSGFLQSTDLNGNARVQDGSGKGYPLIDIGAYEFTGRNDADVTSLVLTSSEYYLRGGNSLALYAQLTDVTQASPLVAEPVTFSVDGEAPVVAATDASGMAALPVSGLSLGLHTMTANFAGTAFSASHSAAPSAAVVLYVYVVTAGPYVTTLLTLTSSQNPSTFGTPVTLGVQSFSPDGTHPGPVTLDDGGTLLATLTPGSSGAASYTTSTLAAGTHMLTASFAGDTVHKPATASLTQIVVPPADFIPSSSAPSITIQTEHHGPLTITVSSVGSFSGTVQLACGALPEYASCTFANAAPQIPVAGSAATTLEIDTDAVHNFASTGTHEGDRSKALLAWLLPLTLFNARRGKRRWFRLTALAALLLAGAFGLSGCSGKYPGHTPPGTYVIPINGTGAVNGVSTTHTLDITLVVTP